MKTENFHYHHLLITCSLEKARRKNKTSLLDRVLGSKGSKVMKVLRSSSSFPTINSLNLLLMQGVRDGTRRVCKCHFWAFSCHFLQRALSILPVNLPFLKQKDLVLILSNYVCSFICSFRNLNYFRVGSSPTTEASLTVAFQKIKDSRKDLQKQEKVKGKFLLRQEKRSSKQNKGAFVGNAKENPC